MAKSPLPLIALGAAALFLLKKKGEPTTTNGKANGNGNGTNGNGSDDADGPAVGEVEPDWSKPNPRPEGMNVTTSWGPALRMGEGGRIDEMTVEGPEGFGINDWEITKGGLGEDMVAIRFHRTGAWSVYLVGIRGDTGHAYHNTWNIQVS